MHIAIVEDTPAHSNLLCDYLSRWSDTHKIDTEIHCYAAGDAFLSNTLIQWDLLFLDIELPDLSGMEIAHTLRANGYQKHIIFLTSHTEYVFEGYQVRALNFLVKPVTYDVLERSLSPVLEEYKAACYLIQTTKYAEKLPFSSIIGFTTRGHYLEINTTGATYEQRESLKNIRSVLPDYFLQCHRTTILNIYHAQKMDSVNIYMTNGIIYPISQKYLANVRHAFMEFLM